MLSEGSNSELFSHENDALTTRPQLHKLNFFVWLHKTSWFFSLFRQPLELLIFKSGVITTNNFLFDGKVVY